MGKNLYGAGEAGSRLEGMTSYGEGENYPITFGRGSWQAGILEQIAALTDNKVRFVDSINNTGSGATFVGGDLVSSKILDITAVKTGEITDVTFKYIDTDGSIKETVISITTPDSIEDMQEFLRSTLITADNESGLTVTQTTNSDGFKSYELDVNTDGTTIAVVNNNLKAGSYVIEKVPAGEVTDNLASQYKLMYTAPGASTATQCGPTIDIAKDKVVRSAHVCTFNRDANGDVITDYVSGTPLYALVDGVLEPAPTNQTIEFNHTYLHLVINTYDDSDTNVLTNDVYLDFTDIFNAGAFAELNQRVSDIESSYVKEIEVGTAVDQFKTITVTTSNNGVETDTTFDIPDSTYYESVNQNFETIEENTTVIKNALTWQGLI